MRIKQLNLLILGIITVMSACTGRNSSIEQGNLSVKNQSASVVTTGLEVGERAPELKYISPDGKEIALSALRGQLVLIDFWASWCMPCRIENPNLVAVYNKYNDKNFTRGKGFTIYSVSLDTDKEAWTRGIETDGLSWEYHVSDLQGWRAAPAALYQVAAIPANFLVDGDGVIIAKNLRAEVLGETIEALLQ